MRDGSGNVGTLVPEHKKLMNVERIRIMKIEASLSHSRYEEMITAKRSLFPVKK